MSIIDSQVHAYERDHSGRPWAAVLEGPDEVTGRDMVAAMVEAGVDAAVLVSPFTMYRYDPSYALEVYQAFPDRFCLVKPVDPLDRAVADTVADWAKTPGAVAVRIMLAEEFASPNIAEGVDRVLVSAAKASLPVNLLCWERLDLAKKLAANHPNTTLVVDHVGLRQRRVPPPPGNPFGDLASLLELAAFDNIRVKISGACTLSHEPFPYNDIWDPLCRVFDAFDLERCLWGTDWTRAIAFLTYQQGVDAFLQTDRLSDSDRAILMGGALEKVYNWLPGDD